MNHLCLWSYGGAMRWNLLQVVSLQVWAPTVCTGTDAGLLTVYNFLYAADDYWSRSGWVVLAQ